jgi:hypothetical protein
MASCNSPPFKSVGIQRSKMKVEALPDEIATLGRTGINEWTAMWYEAEADPDPQRRAIIDAELQAMLCPHQTGARFVYRHPALHQNAADPEIVDLDYSIAEEHGADPKATESQVQIWAHGQCALLALRMHELSGWPILELGIDHFLVLRPDGALVDAYGVHRPGDDQDTSHFDKIADRYGARDACWKRGDCDSYGSTTADEDRSEADEFLETPWMLAVFPMHHRLDSPLSYMALEDRPDDPCEEMEE